MPRPTDTVSADDISGFVNRTSDFAFEIKVLKRLRDLSLSCRHGGTYEDQVTQKTRQYDIHAETNPLSDNEVRLRFAVECKNIRANYPLVMHRVQRMPSEAVIDAILSSKPDFQFGPASYGRRIRLRGEGSRYSTGEFVGKSLDQVGRDKTGEVFGDDRDVFEKMTQALHSSYELLRLSHFAGKDTIVMSVVIPVLVVPDDTLWAIDYDAEGNIVAGPRLCSHATYFVDKDWLVKEPLTGATRYTLSHLEVCTISSMDSFIGGWQGDTRLTQAEIWKAHAEQNGPKRS
jgi:hypothetical protein